MYNLSTISCEWLENLSWGFYFNLWYIDALMNSPKIADHNVLMNQQVCSLKLIHNYHCNNFKSSSMFHRISDLQFLSPTLNTYKANRYRRALWSVKGNVHHQLTTLHAIKMLIWRHTRHRFPIIVFPKGDYSSNKCATIFQSQIMQQSRSFSFVKALGKTIAWWHMRSWWSFLDGVRKMKSSKEFKLFHWLPFCAVNFKAFSLPAYKKQQRKRSPRHFVNNC